MHQLKTPYLLLSVDADGNQAGTDEFVRSLLDAWTAEGVDEIWGGCYGFGPNLHPETFVNYLSNVSFEPTVAFADYPRASLWDVHRSLVTHRAFTDFIFEHDLRSSLSRRLHQRYARTVGQIIDRWPVRPPVALTGVR